MTSKTIQNESGIVLVTVLMIIMVMMIFAVGVMSTNVSQTILTKRVEDRIKAEQLAQGILWLNYMNLTQNSAAALQTPAETLDSKTFTPVATRGSAGGGINNTTSYSFNINY